MCEPQRQLFPLPSLHGVELHPPYPLSSMRSPAVTLGRRKPNRDPVTAETRQAVLDRDRWDCVAPRLGANDWCSGRLQLDHVKDQPRMGVRAQSDPEHLVTLCERHHLGGWATSHRPELREYLRSVA